jgi:hypothetical protein
MLLAVTIMSVTAFYGQQKHKVVETKIQISSYPELADRCESHLKTLYFDWVDDQSFLVGFSAAPCIQHKQPHWVSGSWKTLLIDINGKVLSSSNQYDCCYLKRFGRGLPLRFLSLNKHMDVQIVDIHLNTLKTIPCIESKCNFFLATGTTGFALCRSSDNGLCHYYKGADAEAVPAANFANAFPELQGRRVDNRPPERGAYDLGNGEAWTFDKKCHLSGRRADGSTFSIPGYVSRLDEDCSGQIPWETPSRFLAYFNGGIVWGREMILYGYKRLTLYDVPTHTPLFTWNPGLADLETLSPDGQRVAVISSAGLFRGAEIQIYYIP